MPAALHLCPILQVRAAVKLAWTAPGAGRAPKPLLPPELLLNTLQDPAGSSRDSEDVPSSSSSSDGFGDGALAPVLPFPKMRTAVAAAAVRACLRIGDLAGAFRAVRASRPYLRSSEPFDALIIGCSHREDRAATERAVREVSPSDPSAAPTFSPSPHGNLLRSAQLCRHTLLGRLNMSDRTLLLASVPLAAQAVHDLWAPGPRAARMLLKVMSTPSPLTSTADIQARTLSGILDNHQLIICANDGASYTSS